MTTFRRGEVVLLPFPFTNQTGSKRRPALILSTDAYNRRRGDIIVAPITGNLAAGQHDDTAVAAWSQAGLLKASVVKGVLGTVEQTLVLRVLGTLSATDLGNVERTFESLLGLTVQAAP